MLEITYYRNLADALAEQNSINDISNYTNIGYPAIQDIYVRVDSQVVITSYSIHYTKLYDGNKQLSGIVFNDYANSSTINYTYNYDNYKRLIFKEEIA